jgi:adenylate cyclase
VRALETAQLLRAGYEDLTDCFESNANVATAFMDVVTHRLRRTNLLYQENQYKHSIGSRRLGHLADFIEFPKAKALERGVDSVLERLVQGLARLTDAERVILYLVDPRTGDLWARVAEGIEHQELRVSMSEGIPGWVARNGQLVNVADAEADERFDASLDGRMGSRTHTVLCAPVHGRRKDLVGVLEIVNKRIGIFHEHDESLVRVYAEQAAVTAECSNLYRDVVRSHERMATLLDIATLITQADDLSTMMKDIGPEIVELLACERSFFFAYDPEAEEMWTVVVKDSKIEQLRVPASSLVAGYAAITGEVVNVSDPYGDQRFNPEFDRLTGFRTRNSLCVPVVNRSGWMAGAVQADNKVDGAFGDEELRVLRAIAAQIGVSMLIDS